MQPHQVISLEDLPGRSASRCRTTGTTSTSATTRPSSGYQAPFVDAVRGRIDQGVDFVGSGPIKAIGKARILKVGAPGWPGGRRPVPTARPPGQKRRLNEGIARPSTRAARLAGQEIGLVPGSPTGIEIGFADPGHPAQPRHLPRGRRTRWGQDGCHHRRPGQLNDRFSQLLKPKQWTR